MRRIVPTRRRKLVIVSALLAVAALSLGFFVWANENSGEVASGPQMQMGMGDITRGSNICMGDITQGYAGDPLKWTVLDPDKDNAGNPGAMFLFSKGVVAETNSRGKAQEFRYYNGWINPLRKLTTNNHWHHSSMPKWCDTFMKNVFSYPEQKAIRSVTKKEVPTENIGPFKDKVPHVEPDGHWSGYYDYYQYDLLLEIDTIKEQKVFFPSYDEIKHEDAYASMPGFNPTRYWLRSPGQIYPIYELLDLFLADVGIYTTHAEHKDYGKTHSPAFEYADVAQKCMAKPVMNIEKGSVIFSNVAGAKEDVPLGEMKELDQNQNNRTDWELSLEDPDRRDFDAKAIKIYKNDDNNQHMVEIETTGAKTGNNEYLSAIALDDDGNILYYGRIKNSSSRDDTIQVPLPWYGIRTDINDLYIFSEMYAGENKSSHVSPLRYINLKDPDIAMHIVTFDLNGHGSPQPDWQEVEKGKKATKPENPFAVGYDFRGWFTSPETEETWDFDDVVEDSMTLYAGWEAHEYKIEYYSNGGSGMMDDESRTYQDGKPIADCEFAPPSEGMKFIGWNTRANGSGMNYYPGDTDDLTYNEKAVIKLYAQWSDQLMVAYHLNGHGGPQPDNEITNEDRGWKITKPDEPSDKAYEFCGWYITPDCDQGEAWDFDRDSLDNNTTLFAMWKPHEYMIHFEANGAPEGGMEDMHREYGDNIPIENGFKWPYDSDMLFMGWNTEADGTGRSYEDGYSGDLTDKDGDVVTLYAIWTRGDYRVHFDKNNDNAKGEMGDQVRHYQDPYYEDTPLYKNTFTCEGAVFTGWNDKADGTGRHYEDQTKDPIITQKSTVTLFAQWVSRYTVHFDANGGNGRMDDETREMGDDRSLPENRFIRESYEFAGWNTERDGSGTSYENGFAGDLQVNGDEITLYAQWNISYTIHYDGNGATSGSMKDQGRTFGDDECLTPNEFSNEGFVFDSWNTEKNGTGTRYADKAEGDLTGSEGTVVLYAQWQEECVYTITFDANGGSFDDDETTRTRTTDPYGYLNEFEPGPHGPDGKPFCGWYSDPEGGAKVEQGSRFISHTTLYACWTPQKDDLDWDQQIYTEASEITYDANGGTVDIQTQKTVSGVRNKNKVFISSHPTPQNEPYGFDGWYTARDGGTRVIAGTDDYASPPPTQYMSDTTLYAHWRPMEYTVRFNNNGGQGTMPDQKRTYDDGVRLAHNTFIRTNYKFNGWNTDKNGLGIPYEDEHIGDIADKEETVILYAQWKKKDFTVVFDLNGVDGKPKPGPYSTGPENDYKAERPANDPHAEGYTFGGWYKEPECINEWDFSKDIVTEEITTLYAKWTGNPYTIKFDPGKGTVDEKSGPMKDQQRIVGDNKALPECTYGPPANSSGASFEGWNTKKDGSGEYFEDQSTDDVATEGVVTLYAQWSPTRIVVFNLNGRGSGAPAPQMRGDMHGYKVEEPQTEPTAKGYNFTGWYKDRECTEIWDFENDTLKKAVTTLYAGWDPIEYTVIFDANPPTNSTAEGEMDDVVRLYDDGEALPQNAFVIKPEDLADGEFIFTGWNTEADGSGDGFGDQDSQNITSTDGARITLYAMWNSAQITTTILPDARQDEPYTARLTQMGLSESSTAWNISDEDGDDGLPEGLELDGNTGVISGTTNQAGTFRFTVQVTGSDLMGVMVTLKKKLSLDIIQKEHEVLIIQFTEGMNGNWTKGSSSDLNFKTNGPFNMFTGLEVDGVSIVEGVDYEVSEGSTVIRLKPGYLNTLNDGSHILTADYNDGQAPFTQFTVRTKQDPPKPDNRDRDNDKGDNGDNDHNRDNTGPDHDNDNNGSPSDNHGKGKGNYNNGPSTGDESHLAFWLALMLISIACAGYIIAGRICKYHRKCS